MKNMRLKVGVVAAAAMAATAGLFASAPSASAAGNCYHYGQQGYVQLFTDNNYQGTCWETTTNAYQWLPSEVKDKVSSLRFWTPSGPQQRSLVLTDVSAGGVEFTAQPNEWWPSLPWWINDKADWIEMR
ncbi:hypothetical protein [Streptomyces sp. NPDC059909]|uniref:hypothetical protein n=1 Tax=Streptomyces sp. NPDC059909 TaxID=3346998 RepID=UPI00364C2A79